MTVNYDHFKERIFSDRFYANSVQELEVRAKKILITFKKKIFPPIH